jgi:hypothetical protein
MGLEPATFRLQIGCSTIELRRQQFLRGLWSPSPQAGIQRPDPSPEREPRSLANPGPSYQDFSAEKVRCRIAS